MKKRYQFIFFIMTFMSFINSIYANTSISLECPQSSTVGSIIDCNVIANSDIYLSAISTKLNISSNLELVKFQTDSSWQGVGDNGNIELYTYPNQIGTIKLGIASVKITNDKNSKTATIFLENTKFYKEDFSKIEGNNFSTNIKILSLNNNLSNITLSKGTLSPSFDKNTTDYNVTTDSDNIMIDVTTEDKTATISGNGLKELKDGNNIFTIVVNSEAGTKKEYKINIFKTSKKDEEIKDDDTNNSDNKVDTPSDKDNNLDNNQDNSNTNQPILKLKDLIIEGYQINFKTNIKNYSIDLLYNENKLNITPIPFSNDTKISILGNDNLNIGENEISIVIEDTAGNKNTYTIVANIIDKNNICPVKDIKISNYILNFECNKYDYSIEIKNEDSLNIEVLPTLENTKINIYNNSNLKNEDTITISIKNEYSEYKYNIKVLKNKESIFHNHLNEIIIITIILGCSIYLIIKLILKEKRKNINHT